MPFPKRDNENNAKEDVRERDKPKEVGKSAGGKSRKQTTR